MSHAKPRTDVPRSGYAPSRRQAAQAVDRGLRITSCHPCRGRSHNRFSRTTQPQPPRPRIRHSFTFQPPPKGQTGTRKRRVPALGLNRERWGRTLVLHSIGEGGTTRFSSLKHRPADRKTIIYTPPMTPAPQPGGGRSAANAARQRYFLAAIWAATVATPLHATFPARVTLLHYPHKYASVALIPVPLPPSHLLTPM